MPDVTPPRTALRVGCLAQRVAGGAGEATAGPHPSCIKGTFYYWKNGFIWNVMGKSIMLIVLLITQIDNKHRKIINSTSKVSSVCVLGCNYKI